MEVREPAWYWTPPTPLLTLPHRRQAQLCLISAPALALVGAAGVTAARAAGLRVVVLRVAAARVMVAMKEAVGVMVLINTHNFAYTAV